LVIPFLEFESKGWKIKIIKKKLKVFDIYLKFKLKEVSKERLTKPAERYLTPSALM
jgi:hypothetical protein